MARRARAVAMRQALAAREFDGLDPIDPSSSFDSCEQADLRAAIDAEIARLPAHYRSAVVLCHIEGLSQKQAARRLRCPVGTVESRLHRARGRLRSGLARRGFAPAVGAVVGVLERTSRAAVSPDIAKRTAAAAARISAGQVVSPVVPVSVAGLVDSHLGNMMMRQCWTIAGLIALGITTTLGAVGMATAGGDEPKATPRIADSKAGTKAAAERHEPPLAAKLDRLKDEYEGANRAFHEFYRGSTIPQENMKKALEIQPDFPAVVRRISDLAATAPKEPAVRDAMLWVIRQTRGGRRDGGGFVMAANWLVRHFGDDPDAVRVGLELDSWPNFERDNLLLCFYASAKSRESKGLARLALAQYLRAQGDAGRRGQRRWKAGRRIFTTISSPPTERFTQRRRSCPMMIMPTFCT